MKQQSARHQQSVKEYQRELLKSANVDQVGADTKAIQKMDDMAQLKDRLLKMSRDMELKNRLIAQYSLRENISKSAAPSRPSSSASQTQPPAKEPTPQALQEMNSKMHVVVTEVTTRNYQLEEELRSLKDIIRRAISQ